ncbi:Bug family tripartite tricarboxylate transporter substrate binding protein [Acidovorax sp. 22279]|uniref:Bug family tripartite tricarboxylate transporter substrate binding protein n=1 Tax=Acidovorax sp. 22279 TaxID=3453900 RepID=UPI003F83F945
MIRIPAPPAHGTGTPAMPRGLRCLLHVLGAVLLAGAAISHAQAPAGRMSSMVVAYPAGGPADVTARQLEPAMRRSLGQGFIIENLPGASGAIAIDKVLKAPKDGQMTLFADASNVILAPMVLAAVRHKPDQLRLVGMASRTPLVLVSGLQNSARTLPELMASARKAGAPPLTYGSFGAGSMPHLVSEDFAGRQRIEMTHVPYRGSAPLVQDLIGGQVQLAFLPVGGNTVDLILQKKLKAYAVTSDHRVARLADVPTVAETTDLQNFNFEMWGGVYVPREVPIDVAIRLNKAVDEALQDRDYQRQTEMAGATVGARMNLAELDTFFKSEVTKFTQIARSIKLEPQ